MICQKTTQNILCTKSGKDWMKFVLLKIKSLSEIDIASTEI